MEVLTMFVKKNKTVGLYLMVVTACLVLATLWAVLATPETALAKKPGGGGGGKKQEISVSVTFWDRDGDAVQSDEEGPYTRERGNKVKAFIGMGGQLRLQTWDSTVRSILLNIPDISDPACPDGDFGHANLVTLGEDDDGLDGDGILTEAQLDPGVGGDRLNLLEMGVESSTRAGLRIGFPVPDNKNGDAWRLIFGEVGDEDGNPQTNLVLVTAGADTDGDGKPNSWTIEAGAGTDAAVAALLPAGEAPCAHVSMPFSITVEILP